MSDHETVKGSELRPGDRLTNGRTIQVRANGELAEVDGDEAHWAPVGGRRTYERERRLYTKRDLPGLGEFYLRHVRHMTTEGLHSKADIAAELAFRDARIAELEALLLGAVRGTTEAQEALVRFVASLERTQKGGADG